MYSGTFNKKKHASRLFVLTCFLVSQAYRWCIEAMKEISPGLPVKVVVDVLRQASKVSVRVVDIYLCILKNVIKSLLGLLVCTDCVYIYTQP